MRPLAPPAEEVFGLFHLYTKRTSTNVKADYKRPMPDQGRLTAGFEWQFADNLFSNLRAEGPAPDALQPLPGLTDIFSYRQENSAAYVTYQRPFGDVTVLAGLRVEQVLARFGQIEDPDHDKLAYTRAYPSLQLTWRMAPDKKMTASYGRRIQRPYPNDLNPFRQYADPLNQYAGNPHLKPQITDAFEVSYDRSASGASETATLYYRVSHNSVGSLVTPLDGGVLLTTRENLATISRLGIELAKSGKLSRTLTYNLNGSISRTRLEAPQLGLTEPRTVVAPYVHVSFDWRPTAKDFLQLDGTLTAKRPTAQGYQTGYRFVNFGYRRQLTTNVFAVVTVNDALSSLRSVNVVQTSTLRSRRSFDTVGRQVSVGISYAFGGGGKNARPPDFHFQGAGDASQ